MGDTDKFVKVRQLIIDNEKKRIANNTIEYDKLQIETIAERNKIKEDRMKIHEQNLSKNNQVIFIGSVTDQEGYPSEKNFEINCIDQTLFNFLNTTIEFDGDEKYQITMKFEVIKKNT